MVEFTGHLTGKAEKRFVQKSRRIGLIFSSFAILFALPIAFLVGKFVLHDNAFIYAMLAALSILPIICFIPKGKKEHLSMLPKRIYTRDNHIVCVADKYTDSKLISDVTKVLDYGEFYELCFPFGKLSEKFICQKDLLSRGSIGEFEKLFKGKILRMTKN